MGLRVGEDEGIRVGLNVVGEKVRAFGAFVMPIGMGVKSLLTGAPVGFPTSAVTTALGNSWGCEKLVLISSKWENSV